VTQNERGLSFGLVVERYGPLASGMLGFLVNNFWFRFTLLDHPDWGNRLLDRVIQATSVGVAFWGIAITLFIGMESRPLIENLKRLGYFRVVVRYFCEALFATFLLLSLSVLLEPLTRQLSPMMLSSVWIALGVWALVTTFRTYTVFSKILARIE
jgi:hypothetical protein